VGRTDEFGTLSKHLKALPLTKAGKLYLLHGVAGIGKSHLMQACASAARKRSLGVFAASCSAVECDTPLYVFAKLLEDLIGVADVSNAQEAAMARARQSSSGVLMQKEKQQRSSMKTSSDKKKLETVAGDGKAEKLMSLKKLFSQNTTLAQLMPLLNNVLGTSLEDNQHTAGMSGPVRAKNTLKLCANIICAKAQQEPLVLVLDNVQWMDPASWTLVEWLHYHPEGKQLTILLAVRTSDANTTKLAASGGVGALPPPGPASSYAQGPLPGGAAKGGGGPPPASTTAGGGVKKQATMGTLLRQGTRRLTAKGAREQMHGGNSSGSSSAQPPGEELLSQLPQEQKLGLKGLQEGEVEQLIRSVLDAEKATMPPSLAEWLVKKTGGNPFFVKELTSNLVASGKLKCADGRVSFDAEVTTPPWLYLKPAAFTTLPYNAPASLKFKPFTAAARARQTITESDTGSTIENVMQSRVDALSADCVDVLKLASVLGDYFSSKTLRKLAREVGSKVNADRRCRELCTLDILTYEKDGNHGFKAQLIREIVYHGMTFEQRMQVMVACHFAPLLSPLDCPLAPRHCRCIKVPRRRSSRTQRSRGRRCPTCSCGTT
tara:strand:- start:623 stop:2434 length:1812 start_codon:yes stop_codon:yes gene_type:complete